MINVGIIGLGSMGMTHLEAYSRLDCARVIAVADRKFADPRASLGRVGNVAGQVGEVALGALRKYTDANELLADPEVVAVDICAPTHLHREFALAAIRAGKSVLVEKPLARTAAAAREMADAACAAGVVLMPAHCMRFWRGWDWLKEVVVNGRFGVVESAAFTRIGAKPTVPFYNDGVNCGGAHLDLHIHDADFVLHLFGMPLAATSFGRLGESGAVEHTFTRYQFAGMDAFVTAEGGWTRASENRPFVMRFVVTFERATAVYHFGADPELQLYRPGREPEAVVLAPQPGLGYASEVAEFVRCVEAGRASERVTAEDGVCAIQLIEAELRSIESGQTVYL
ncbi:MAG: Gfo/Idh/MocA family oxidoreductase [Puniceicoccales bacterium]|jgi:predicted dehydrogenase|nr:Gfo/Idh/MocA family oxidoreductase [Puniceicoccales bacterium]